MDSSITSPHRMRLLRAFVVVAVGAAAALVGAAPDARALGPNAIQHLDGCTDNTLARNDDGSTSLVDIGFTLNFFGTTYSQLYVNNNGNLTFADRLGTFTPFGLTSAGLPPIIAPFFADVDTRNVSSGEVTYGQTEVDGRPAFCAMWEGVGGSGVGYYNSNADRLNNFQALLVDRSNVGAGDFDIIFNYDQIQWETGQASGGVGGLGGTSAAVGYTNGTGAPGTNQELPGSRVPGSFLDGGPSSLVAGSRNSLHEGRYVFPVRGGLAPTGGTVHGTVTINPPVVGALVQICDAQLACINALTNSSGNYSASGLPPGEYTVRVFAPAGMNFAPQDAGPATLPANGSLEMNVHVEQPGALPDDVEMEPLRDLLPDGVPSIFVGDDISVVKRDQCSGAQVWFEVRRGRDSNNDGLPDSIVYADPGFNESPNGDGTSDYSDVIPGWTLPTGNTVWVVYVDCPPHDGISDPPTAPDNIQIWNVYIDPSGVVVNQHDDPIEGATVTLFRSEDPGGPFTVVPDGSAVMSPSNRDNPDQTDAAGHFGWDTIAGYYTVQASADGCHAPGDEATSFVETDVLTIPPPVTDLRLELECPGAPVTDTDGDGVNDDDDQCDNDAEDPDGFQDADGCPDPDNDGDGVNDDVDGCDDEAEDPDGFEDADGCPDPDNDGDGALDGADNCPNDANGDQADNDGDAEGDVCDPDDDNDTVADAGDNCATTSNSNQRDTDGDGIGDACDATPSPATCTITGTEGDDVLIGTNRDDVICGLGGNDHIVGGNGNDVLVGGLGDDTMAGGNGNDALYGGNGADDMSGDNGEDHLEGGNEGDTMSGGNGDDTMNGESGADTMTGENGADTMNGGADNDSIIGGNGKDTIDGGAGTDSCSDAKDSRVSCP